MKFAIDINGIELDSSKIIGKERQPSEMKYSFLFLSGQKYLSDTRDNYFISYDENAFTVEGDKNNFTLSSKFFDSFKILEITQGHRLKIQKIQNGIIPLFIFLDREVLAVSSNLKVLVQNFAGEFNPKAITSTYLGLNNLLPETFYKNIYTLMNGDAWEVDIDMVFQGKIDFSRYIIKQRIFEPQFTGRFDSIIASKDESKIIKTFANVLSESFEKSAADVNGLFLSGGIDSVAVAGALKALSIPFTFFHIHRPNYFDIDTECVQTLQNHLSLDGEIFTVDWKDDSLIDGIFESLLLNLNTFQVSSTLYLEGAKKLNNKLPEFSSVFNGELNFLDVGTSEEGDRYRRFKRWVYGPQGLKWHGGKLNEPKLEFHPILKRFHNFFGYNRATKLIDMFFGLLRSYNNSANTFWGKCNGIGGLPGIYLREYLHITNNSTLQFDKVIEDFSGILLSEIEKYDFQSRDFFFDLVCKIMSESRNLTIPRNIIYSQGLLPQQPYNSVEIVEFVAKIDTNLYGAKEILRKAAEKYLNIPHNIAYNMKDHTDCVKKLNDTFWNGRIKKRFQEAIDRDFILNEIEKTDINIDLFRDELDDFLLDKSEKKAHSVDFVFLCLALSVWKNFF